MPFSKNSPRDANAVPTALFEVSTVPGQTLSGQIDQSTGRILVDMAGGGLPVISSAMQKDEFTSTAGQTTFTPSKTLVYDFYMSINGVIQTPAPGAIPDYSIIAGNYVLTNGIPVNCVVILLYSIT
jgi:hypothetical protein